MTLSVLVLTCNQLSTTLRCLDALSVATAGMDSEIILVDNGSTDGTSAAVAAKFPDVDVFTLPENIGVAAGRNEAMRHAGGEYILILDNDTVPTRDVIAGLMAHLEANPRCGIAAPRLDNADGSWQESCKDYPGIKAKARNVLGFRTKESMPGAMSHPCYVIGACQMMRADTMRRLGPLDEKIFYGPEDADYCLRAAAAGYTIDYLPHLRMTHDHRHATRRRLLSSLGRRHLAALCYFWRKHRRWW